MIEVWYKYAPDGRQVFYRMEGNVNESFVSSAFLEGEAPTDKVQSKEQPSRADVEERFGSYIQRKLMTG